MTEVPPSDTCFHEEFDTNVFEVIVNQSSKGTYTHEVRRFCKCRFKSIISCPWCNKKIFQPNQFEGHMNVCEKIPLAPTLPNGKRTFPCFYKDCHDCDNETVKVQAYLHACSHYDTTSCLQSVLKSRNIKKGELISSIVAPIAALFNATLQTMEIEPELEGFEDPKANLSPDEEVLPENDDVPTLEDYVIDYVQESNVPIPNPQFDYTKLTMEGRMNEKGVIVKPFPKVFQKFEPNEYFETFEFLDFVFRFFN